MRFAEYEPTRNAEVRPFSGRVELARDGDLHACAELLCSYSGGDVQEREAALASYLTDPSRCLFVARLEDIVIGYGKADHFTPPTDASPTTAPDGYYLSGLVVADSARRRGV